MTDVYIFDAVRTPRGKGRNGSLQEVPPAHLAAGALRAIRERNALDTAEVDDVVLGCVAPVGEQGSVIGRTAVLLADYDQSVAGMQVNRFCASGLDAVNIAASKVMACAVLGRPLWRRQGRGAAQHDVGHRGCGTSGK